MGSCVVYMMKSQFLFYLLFWPVQTGTFQEVESLDDTVRVVNESATPNVVQLVGAQDGEIVISMYDWSSFFDNAKVKTAIKGIKNAPFSFSKGGHPGKVMVHNSSNDKWRMINLLEDPSWRPLNFPELE